MKNELYRIICPNTVKGNNCRHTIAFVSKEARDIEFFTAPCSCCKAITRVHINDRGNCYLDVLEKRDFYAPNMSFVSKGEYVNGKRTVNNEK